MLSLSVLLLIDRMLQEGALTRRQIAERAGVSRGTVGAIARDRQRMLENARRLEADDGDTLASSVRCPKCGFRVHMPCLVCRTREYRAQQKCLRKTGGAGAAASRRQRAVKRGRGRPRRVRVA